jgi:hypothetical protein
VKYNSVIKLLNLYNIMDNIVVKEKEIIYLLKFYEIKKDDIKE